MVANVNTFHYGRGITGAMHAFLTGGFCDIENVRFAAGRGATALRGYVERYVDPIDDALAGGEGETERGAHIVAALVHAGLDSIDWSALCAAITAGEAE